MDVDTLLVSAREGHESAGPLLVSVFGPRLAKYVSIIARDISEVDSEVICERAVERAVEKIDLYREELGSFDAWLRGFARHEVLNWRRRNSISMPVGTADWIADPSDGNLKEKAELIGAVQVLMRQLSETDQLIIALRDFEQLPYEDIALRLGSIQVDACRQRHARAIGRLRALAVENKTISAHLRKSKND